MFNLPYLLRHTELMQYVLGINYQQFTKLLQFWTPVLNHAQINTWPKQPRLRSLGAGRKAHLKSPKEQLFFILFYYKTYPTFRFAQVLWGFDKRNIQLWVKRLDQVLFATLGYELTLHTTRVRSLNHWLEVCPQLSEFIVDCSERLINKPQDKLDWELYYSGKKKRHTIKNQILISPRTKKILAVSDMVEGKRHDKKVFEDSYIYTRIPKKTKALGDSAYQGVHHPFLRLTTPVKKPPGDELSWEIKQQNRFISQIRVRVEHPLAFIKHFNITSQVFRGRIPRAELPFKTIACIYNFTRTYR